MPNSTFIQIPNDLDNVITLRRVLTSIVEIIDEMQGNRGDGKVATESQLVDTESQLVTTASSLSELSKDFNALDDQFIRVDGKNTITSPISYTSSFNLTGNDLVDYSTMNTSLDIIRDSILELTQESAPSKLSGNVDAVAMSAKVDELIDALKTSGILS